MRIAHFIQRYPPALGGSEAYFARLSRWLAARGDSVTVFTTTAVDLEALWSAHAASVAPGAAELDGVSVLRYQPRLRLRGRRWLLRPLRLIPHATWRCLTLSCNPFVVDLWRDCNRPRQRFDVVHASAFPYAFPIVCARRLARRLGVPFCLTPFLHLGDPADPRDATRRAYTSNALMSLARSADRVFAQTPGEEQALLRGGVERGKLVLQGLGVDREHCGGGSRQRGRAAWGIDQDTVVVGHLANNSVEKGTVDLLRAAEYLWQRGLPFHVVLAGPQMPNFQAYCRGRDFGRLVTHLGRLSEEQKRDFYAGIDLFALPSRSDSFGLVLLEAWASGVPSVAYRAGGIADLIRHQSDGLLVPCGDIPALADAIRKLVVDPESRRRFGQQGCDRLHTEFNWEEKLGIVADVYQSLAPACDPHSARASVCGA
jgi:glycosyltransferase involved in cell wall biosynthesis